MYWRRREVNSFSPKFQSPEELLFPPGKYYEDFFINKDKPNIQLKSCGFRYSYPEYARLNNCSQSYYIYYIIDGKAIINNTVVKSGDVIFITNNIPFSVATDPNDLCTLAWISFRGEAVEVYLNELNLRSKFKIFRVENFEEILGLIYQILYEKPEKIYHPLYIESLFLRILGLSRAMSDATQKKEDFTPIEKHVYSAMKYISRNYKSEDFRVSNVCGAIGISEKYLRKIFRENVGMSIKQYVTRMRINDAKYLLGDSQNNITEIAARVGYKDYRRFYEQFKDKVGVSPSQFSINRFDGD